MRDTSSLMRRYAVGRAATLRNSEKLSANANRFYWYRQLYQDSQILEKSAY
jgi:hypothetical protein